jgi:hypothetical protein
MKGSITRGGRLLIERCGQMRPQKCPRSAHYSCNDECPHFDDSNPEQLLLTCGGTAVLIDIEKDERMTDENHAEQSEI